MSEPLASPTPATAPPAPEKPAGFLQNLIDVYVSPREAFTRIVRGGAWLAPAIALLLVAVASTGIWLTKVDAHAFTERQMEEFGGKRWANLTSEQRAQGLEAQAKFMPVIRWVQTAIGTPLQILVMAGVLLFVFRFFYAAETTFRQSLVIVSWSLFPVDLVRSALRILVMWLKHDWDIEPSLALQASPGAFLDHATAKWLWALLSVPDAFSLWLVFLLATGFAVASRRTTASAIWGVATPWLLLALLGVGAAAVFM